MIQQQRGIATCDQPPQTCGDRIQRPPGQLAAQSLQNVEDARQAAAETGRQLQALPLASRQRLKPPTQRQVLQFQAASLGECSFYFGVPLALF